MKETLLLCAVFVIAVMFMALAIEGFRTYMNTDATGDVMRCPHCNAHGYSLTREGDAWRCRECCELF